MKCKEKKPLSPHPGLHSLEEKLYLLTEPFFLQKPFTSPLYGLSLLEEKDT